MWFANVKAIGIFGTSRVCPKGVGDVSKAIRKHKLKEKADGLMASQAVRLVWHAIQGYSKHNCVFNAAALAFWGFLALIPLTLLALWIVTALVGNSADASKELTRQLGKYLTPEAAQNLMNRVQDVASEGLVKTVGSWWSALLFLWSGVSFYFSLQSSLSMAWGGPKSLLLRRRAKLALGAFLGAGMMLALAILMSAAIAALQHDVGSVFGFSLSPVWWVVARLVEFALGVGVFFFLYRFMPGEPIDNATAFWIALGIAGMWELGKFGFTYFVVEQGKYAGVFGPMASLVLILVWIYYSCSILLFGAELGAAWQAEARGVSS